MDFIGKQ